MENKRILNRIIFINIANTDYASIQIAGNTCFVGTNNLGKTTLQRAILFFYSANTRGLGIASSQKPFEDYYFQYPNSYIIYEIATENSFFHVMVYRQNKIIFRFVEGQYLKENYIVESNALLPKEIHAKFNESKINFSDQVETFEKYRNIIYGSEPDKKYRGFSLLKGNRNYHNIPLAITSIFLSSESVIKSQFVKECIANSIGAKQTNIELQTVGKTLRKFIESYHDVETFYRKEITQRGDIIQDNFAEIKNLRNIQKTLAQELGSAILYARQKQKILEEQLNEKDLLLNKHLENFTLAENELQEKIQDTNQEIGVVKSRINEVERKQKYYENAGIKNILLKYEKSEELKNKLYAKENEYQTLTTTFQDVEQQYKILIDGINNEKKQIENSYSSQQLEIQVKYQDKLNEFQQEQRVKEEILKERLRTETSSIKDFIHEKEISYRNSEHREESLKSKKYYHTEINILKENIREIEKRNLEIESEVKLKLEQIESLKKEAEFIKEKTKLKLNQFSDTQQLRTAIIKENLEKINAQLSVYKDALYGFLQTNYPDWQQSIGKVCREEILFSNTLNPKLLKFEFDTLYGVSLDLSTTEVHCKSLEEYETDKENLIKELDEINSSIINFRKESEILEHTQTSKLGKAAGKLKDELSLAAYESEQNKQKLKSNSLDLREWQNKAENQRQGDIGLELALQKSIKDEIDKSKSTLLEISNKNNNERKEVAKIFNHKIGEAKKLYENEKEHLISQKEIKVTELNKEKDRILKEKMNVLKKEGFDNSFLKQAQEQISSLKKELKSIDEFTKIVNDFYKDKKELFDHIEDFNAEKLNLEAILNKAKEDFKLKKRNYEKVKEDIQNQKSELLSDIKQSSSGLAHFEKHFKEKSLYERLKHFIHDNVTPLPGFDIIELCTRLINNESEYFRQFEYFKNHIKEYAGRFRNDNSFHFYINPAGGEAEYERFARELQSFQHENRIQTHITEIVSTHGSLIDSIYRKVKNLSEHKSKINEMIGKMEADFSKASFEGSQLIEYIKLKSEDSENKVLKKLQKIAEFYEQNPFLYGEVNLFNNDLKGKSEIDRKSVELLHELQKTISEERFEEIRVEDLFELKFRIKEGKNDTGWIDKIDKVGSTGTDMLVKAVIYITLLNVFIKESTENTAQNFKVHCIIDEVGQISATYLKELIKFAEERNIFLVNGLPNESKLETHYNYTYKFRKDSRGNIKVIPLLTMSVEV